MMRALGILTFVLTIAWTQAAQAVPVRSVFLNGVDISELRSQVFKNATVSIDQNGNIHIDAPGYKVEVIDSDKPQSASQAASVPPAPNDRGGPNPALTESYYLVTQPSPQGRAQYDFVVSVNGEQRKVIESGAPQIILEISAWLHPGENEVVITARKDLSDGRKSAAPSDEERLILGVGHVENKVVKIDTIKAQVKVDASQVMNLEKHFVVLVR